MRNSLLNSWRFFKRVRFGIRSLLVLTALICTVLGVFAYELQQARRARLLLGRITGEKRAGIVLCSPRSFLGFEADRILYWKRFADWLGEPFLYQRVHHLVFQGDGVTEQELRAIADYLRCERISIHHSRLSDAAMAELARMPLVSLDLSQLEASPEGFAMLAAIPTLGELEVIGPGVNDELIGKIEGFKSLYELRIASARVSAAGLRSVARAPRLRYLFVSGEQLPDEAIDVIAGMTQLERLDLCGVDLKDARLAKLVQLKNLRSLMLYNNSITKEGLATLKQLPRLSWLDIRTTEISEDALPVLGQFTNLKRLDLDVDNKFRKDARRQLRRKLPSCIVKVSTPDNPGMATPFVESKARIWLSNPKEEVSPSGLFTSFGGHTSRYSQYAD